MPDPRKFRGALIGCGYFAQFHLDAWKRMPDVALVAACDPQLERAAALAGQAFTRAEDLFAACPLDFVDIATRPESHAHLVRMAAAHGVNAICQKPMAPGMADARAMVQDAAAAGIRLMIHDNWRWQPWYRRIGEYIAAGRIGQPAAYTFRTRKRDGVGIEPYAAQPYFREMPRLLIHEVLVHHIDVARFLFGDIASIFALARRRNSRITGEDQALIALRHRAEVDGCIDGHRFADTTPDGPVMGEMVVDGEDGVLAVSPGGDVLHNGEVLWENQVVSGYRGDSVYATQAHFIAGLRSGCPFETGASEYLQTFASAEAAYESIRTGLPVQLLPDCAGR